MAHADPLTFALIATIFFTGCFVQTVAGFGAGLIVAPLLMSVGVLRLDEAVAMMSVVWVGQGLLMLWRYHQGAVWSAIWRLIVGLLPGVWIGVATRQMIAERWVLGLLGVVVICFALYSLIGPRLPHLHSPRWAYLFGTAAGVLGGAYTTGGPPIVIYAACRRWDPDPFRGSFAAVGIIASGTVAVTSLAVGDFSPLSGAYLPAGLLGLFLGFGLGSCLNRYVPARLFRCLVLVLLIVIGLRLIGRSMTLFEAAAHGRPSAPPQAALERPVQCSVGVDSAGWDVTTAGAAADFAEGWATGLGSLAVTAPRNSGVTPARTFWPSSTASVALALRGT